MINYGYGARSNDSDESSVVADGDGREMLVDEKYPHEHSIAVCQDSERRPATGWLHGSGPGGSLFPRSCSTHLQIAQGVHLRSGGRVPDESDAHLWIRYAEIDGEEDVQESR